MAQFKRIEDRSTCGRVKWRAAERAEGIGRALRSAKDGRVKPTIGRIVHYMSLGSADGKFPPETQAALVTGLNHHPEGSVSLKIFYRTGIFDMDPVPFAETPTRGHWNWPPMVKQ